MKSTSTSKNKKSTSRKKNFTALWLILSAAFIVVLILVLVNVNSQVTPTNPNHYRSQGHDHRPELTSTFHYNSTPPTSGPHDEVFPSSFIVDKPMEKTQLIHMLEHGNIVVAYNDLPAPEITQLQDWVNKKNAGIPAAQLQMLAEQGKLVFMTPWPEMKDSKISLLAWTRIYPINTYSAADLDAFAKKWLGNQTNINQ